MSEVPASVSESTAIEIKRREGSEFSAKAIGTITAGNVLKFGASGLIQMIGTETDNQLFVGAAYQGATSGQRVGTMKGYLNLIWDGVGTVVPGTLIKASTTYSGMVTAGTALSGGMSVGIYAPRPGTSFASLTGSASGLLIPVETV